MNTLKQRMYVFIVVGLLLLLTGCTTSENITIVFDTNGGSVVDAIITDDKTTLNLPNNPTKEDFTFDGWYFDNETFELTFTNISQISITNGRVTVYAKWIPIETELSQKLRGIYQLATELSSFTGTYEEWLETVRGPQGLPGTNGKNVLVRVNGTKFEWQHEGDSTWTELYDLNSLKGTNGKEVILQVDGEFIQWQYVGDSSWTNLISLSALTGAKGDQGETGIGVKDTYLNTQNELVIIYTDESEINIGQLAIIYTVVFKDYNGYILDVQTLTYGASANTPLNPVKVGYTFTGWSDTFDNVTVNKEIKAEYTINTYTITFDTKGEETVDLMSDVPYGSTIILPTPTRHGYNFIGWYKGDSIHSTHFGDESIVTSDATLYARWQRSTFMVQFIDYNETILYSELVIYGTSANKPANPSRVGYIFTGWDKSFNIVESDLTITAEYTPINYTILFESNGGSNISSITLPYESILPTLPTPTQTGHDFMGWYTDELLTNTFDSNTMPLNGATLYGKWELSTYHIIFDTVGGDVLVSLPVIYSSQVNQLPSATKTDFIFDGWLFGDESFTVPFTYLYTDDITLVAKWKGLAEGVEFEATSTEVTITSYVGSDSEIVLPNTIGGLPITSIAPSAFKNNNTITSLTLGSYITTIGNEAFRNMSELTYISMPASAKMIGTQILYESNKLETMVISSEAAYELRYYFGNNINFVPNSLSLIKYAKGSLTIDKTLTQNNMKGITLELADDTEMIKDDQFANSAYLTSIVIPALVKTIGNYAFNNNSSLKSVVFSEYSQLEIIGIGAFHYATSLSHIIIPKTVSNIESRAFMFTSSLRSVSFENNSQLNNIGVYGFYYASSLQDIVLPNDLQTIESYAFYNNRSLNSIVIPASVMFLGEHVFVNSSSITIYAKILLQPNGWSSNWNSSSQSVVWGYHETIEDDLLNYATSVNGTISILGLSSKAGSDIQLCLPSHINNLEVTQIINYAFHNEDRLSTITIPHTIKSIQQYTFYGAKNLTKVLFEDLSQLETIGQYAFYDASLLKELIVPQNLISIGDYAFLNTKLTKFFIPKSVISMGAFVFSGISELTVYAEASTKLPSWNDMWNSDMHPVVWNWGTDGFPTLFFVSNGGSEVDPITQLYNISITQPIDPVREGYMFDGWYSDSKLTQIYNFNLMPVLDIYIFAKWIPNEYTLTFDSLNGSDPFTMTQLAGTSLYPPTDPTRHGYIFNGWYIDDAFQTPFNFSLQFESKQHMIDQFFTEWNQWACMSRPSEYCSTGSIGPITLINAYAQRYSIFSESENANTWWNHDRDAAQKWMFLIEFIMSVRSEQPTPLSTIAFNTDTLSRGVTTSSATVINEILAYFNQHHYTAWPTTSNYTNYYLLPEHLSYLPFPVTNLTLYAKWNSVTLFNPTKDFYVTGQWSSWGEAIGNPNNLMLATTLDDIRIDPIANVLDEATAIYLFQWSVLSTDAGWTITYKINGETKTVNGHLALKVVSTDLNDADAVNWWGPSPESGQIYNLTPSILYIPPYIENNVDNAGAWNDYPILIGEVGTYYVVYAEVNNQRYIGLLTLV